MNEGNRKRQLKASYKAQERAVLEASMPLTKGDLRALFEHLERTDARACDHTLKETMRFLEASRIDAKAVLPWLHHHGGHCDCEVIYNVLDKYGDLVEYRSGV